MLLLLFLSIFLSHKYKLLFYAIHGLTFTQSQYNFYFSTCFPSHRCTSSGHKQKYISLQTLSTYPNSQLFQAKSDNVLNICSGLYIYFTNLEININQDFHMDGVFTYFKSSYTILCSSPLTQSVKTVCMLTMTCTNIRCVYKACGHVIFYIVLSCK